MVRVSAHPEREDRAIVNAKIGASWTRISASWTPRSEPREHRGSPPLRDGGGGL